MESDAQIDPAPYRPTRRRLILTGAVAAGIVALLVVAGVVPRLRAAAEAQSDRERAATELAHVQVELPVRPAAGGKVVLPGTMRALQEAVVNARTSGYIHSFDVDLGDHVKVGQVLATLDTPDVDQELRAAEAATVQANANIEQAQTQLALASTEATRYQTLAGSGVVSQQDMEEHRASFDARGASLRATQAARQTAQANVQRLRELKSFATVVAPFDGVITGREIEVGQLVAAGTGAPMFHIANTRRIRVFVNVPQVYAAGVQTGDEATVALREIPNRTFVGKVARTAHAIDPGTRTLLVSILVPNDDGALLPGMYAEVTLGVSRTDAPLMIHPSSLVSDAGGTRVAVVDHGVVHWRVVRVDSDLGDQVAILSGLSPGDQVIVAPSERLTEGLAVVADAAKPSPAPKTAALRGSGSSEQARPLPPADPQGAR